MMWKACTVLLGLAVRAFTIPASGLQPRANGEVSTVTPAPGKRWSAIELRQMSMGPNMAAAVFGMASIEEDKWSGAKMFRKRILERINHVAVTDLRSIVLGEATKGKIGKSTKLAAFAATEDPAATCAAADTAGWGGIANCVEKCGNSGRYYHRVASQEGACLVLCTLAVDPCTEKNSPWTTWRKKWMGKTGAMLVRVVPATVAFLKEGAAGGKNLVMTLLDNDDNGTLLLLLSLLLVAQIARDSFDRFNLRSRARRAENDLAINQRRTARLTLSRFCRPRRKKAREYAVYNRSLVRWPEYVAIGKAKIAAASRREACDSLAAALTSAAKNAGMAARFSRWKGEAKAVDAVGRKEGLTGEGEGHAW